jgi:TonB family protein
MKCENYAYLVLFILTLCFFSGISSAEDGSGAQFGNRILHVCSSGIRNNACAQTSKRTPGNAAGRLPLLPDSGQVNNDYMSNVEAKIATFFVLPSGFYKNLSAIVIFEIARNGNVYRKSLEKKSGNYNFDMEALRAVDAAAPFASPPRELTGVEIRVTFHP